MADANLDQHAFWNGVTGDKWARYQAEIDRSLADAARALLPFAAPQPGEHVLDIGCGTGTTSVMWADAVGNPANVTGVDISAPMLAAARSRLPGATFIEADATFHSFAPDYDLLTSRFGVMFFDDPVAAFANMRKALKPTGRLAFVCWRAAAENEWVAAPVAAARPLMPPSLGPTPNDVGQFSMADADRTRGILEAAGFNDVSLTRFDGKMDLGLTLDEATFYVTRLIGPISRAMKDLDKDTRVKVTEAARGALVQFQTPQGYQPGISCWLVSARP